MIYQSAWFVYLLHYGVCDKANERLFTAAISNKVVAE